MTGTSRLRWRYSALSDLGPVRKNNQDSGYAGPHLLMVADGVGGSARGDVASATAVEELRRLDTPPGNDPLSDLQHSLNGVHDRIVALTKRHAEVEGTSTTVTAVLFDGSRIALAHVGDSRAYLLREGELSMITHDHTFVQGLVDEGRISADEARVHPHRNLILRAVDGAREPDPDLSLVEVQVGDRLLVCSDGLTGVVEDADVAHLLGEGTVDFAAVELVQAALAANATDNVTVVLAEVIDADAEDPNETVAMSIGPLLVGAAAEAPRFDPIADTTASDLPPIETDVEERLEPEVDPEDLRYAPQPPKRFRWLRRLLALGVVAVLLWLGGTAAYAWTQKQYYVGASGDYVAIFRGVQADVPLVSLNSEVEQTGIPLESLSPFRQGQVRNGMDATSLADARDTVERLRVAAACENSTPTPKPTPKPTKKGAKSASPTPSATPSPDPCEGVQ